MGTNVNLNLAKANKKDEFYTQRETVEHEIEAYLHHNPALFRNKTVLCPCDDPEWSSFTQYFVDNFTKLGLRRFISTSRAAHGTRGKILDYKNPSTPADWLHLEGDGDFRSPEITQLRDQADIVITNPPFSLFRDFMKWLFENPRLQFSIIGPLNSIGYRNIFPHILNNTLWLGATMHNGAYFSMPHHYVQPKGKDITKLGFARWLTNVEHDQQPAHMVLHTMEYNRKNNFRIASRPYAYHTYDNYDAIEVPFVSGIPSDYDGVMGIPFSFLDSYNPSQFRIVGTCIKNLDGGVHRKGQGRILTVDGIEVYRRLFIQRVGS